MIGFGEASVYPLPEALLSRILRGGADASRHTWTMPPDAMPMIDDGERGAVRGAVIRETVTSLEHAAKEHAAKNASAAHCKKREPGVASFDILRLHDRKGDRLSQNSFSTARLSRIEILGFADRPRDRGALIAGDVLRDLLLRRSAVIPLLAPHSQNYICTSPGDWTRASGEPFSCVEHFLSLPFRRSLTLR